MVRIYVVTETVLIATIFVSLLQLWVGDGFCLGAGRGLHKLLTASVVSIFCSECVTHR